MPKHIVFTPWGSFGDVHPHIALAVEMQRRGFETTIATSAYYQSKIESEGIRFVAVRPDIGQYADDPAMVNLLMDSRRGPEFLVRKVLMPHLRETYDDLAPVASSADLLVSHSVSYATPILAEQHARRWISVALQPLLFFSAYDLPKAPEVALLRRLPVPARRAFFGSVRFLTRSWFIPLHRFRHQLGLPRAVHPLFGGQFSPHGTLGLFSSVLAQAQPDWPPHTRVTGYAFYDRVAGQPPQLSPQLEEFLAAGDPPIAFTLGTSSAFVPSHFFESSAQAARLLNRRAVLLTVRGTTSLRSDENLFVTDYAPFSLLFPRVAAIVHSAGVGTGGYALRAGKPSVMVPFSQDQPDNAARMERLGVGVTIGRREYDAVAGSRAIQRVLTEPRFGERSREIAGIVATEDGVKNACDQLEAHCRGRQASAAV